MSAGPPLRVVVVDDAEELRLVVRTTLERDGMFEVVGEAADGAAAVDVVRDAEPDLVLLDLDMPGVGGLEALPSITAAAPAAHVVILSGLPRSQHEGPALAAGAVGFLEKGLPSRRLVDELVALGGLLDTVGGVLAEQRARLDAGVEAPRAARRFVDETLRRWDCADALGTVSLLVSELTTNAVVHARSAPEVGVLLHRDCIRVEVADSSPVLPQPRHARDHEPSGRGLTMVAELSTAWGTEPLADGSGKVVWFEVPRLDSEIGPRIR